MINKIFLLDPIDIIVNKIKNIDIIITIYYIYHSDHVECLLRENKIQL